MSKVPKKLQKDDYSEILNSLGLTKVHQGKVRDTWSLKSITDKDALLFLASDRVSIFDFVLNALVPKKGEVLTGLTHFWLTLVMPEFTNHLIPSDFDSDENYINDLANEYGELNDILSRGLIVENLQGKMWDFEMIFRHHIGGSVFKKYQETGQAGGQQLPIGLPQWSKLEEPIFTPSTKEEIGHDINVDAAYFFKVMEERGIYDEAQLVVTQLADAYKKAYKYAAEKGVLILDTKFEVAGLTLADEILTPDSSRFVKEDDWQEAMKKGQNPKFLDKQPIRDWGSIVETPFYKDGKQIIGINNLKPENPAHVEFVHGLTVPDKVISDATDRYLKIFRLLTGFSLDNYQGRIMGI